jgi:hypothetical protein
VSYIVKTGKGDRPYQIINQKTREVVGTSKTLKNAYGSIAHRTDAEEKKVSNFKFKKDNKMHKYGEVNYDKREVRINKSKSKNKLPGEILDSIVHEKTHILHPKMKEKNVIKAASHQVAHMSRSQKQKHYSLVK